MLGGIFGFHGGEVGPSSPNHLYQEIEDARSLNHPNVGILDQGGTKNAAPQKNVFCHSVATYELALTTELALLLKPMLLSLPIH